MSEEYKSIRYGDFIREKLTKHVEVSYNELTPRDGDVIPQQLELSKRDAMKLVKPYISVRFMDQVRSLVPLALYLALFQLFLLRQPIEDAGLITGGLFAVIIGLMFFMEGLKQGLMPFGEIIGNTLPKKAKLPLVLFIAFLLGIGVTFAEPAIGALKAAGSLVKPEVAPYLYAMLNIYSGVLVLIVGAGVGIAAILGTLRFVHNWSLKPLIYGTLAPTLALTAYIMGNPDLAPTLGLAWDSGAVTTGPVTVPLVLALGIGIASAAGKGDSTLSGFGIVTLASLFPILGVMSLATFLYFTITPEEILAMVATVGEVTTTPAWYETSPGEEVVLGVRAIVPLVIFLFFVLYVVLREKIKSLGTIMYGISLSVIGMCIFNVGLTYGLSALGGQAGGIIPAAFNDITTENGVIEQLYPYALGLTVALIFAWVLGFGATLAEPALNALGITVQDLTQGVFKKKTLMYAVSLGVGTGIAVGIAKIIFDIPLGYLLLPAYAVAIILTILSTEEFVNIAWDSAGVTTGPITVPLVLAMGLGFGNAVGAIDGFGILSMASIGPIIAVLSTGLWVRYKKQIMKMIKKEEV